jgi:hypothetical protein
VNDGADRNVPDRERIAWLDVRTLASHDLIPDRKALRCKDVGVLAVAILDQCKPCRAVRIVFQTLDEAIDIELASLEIDDPVKLLMSAALVANRDVPMGISPAHAGLALHELLERAALPEFGAVDEDQLT